MKRIELLMSLVMALLVYPTMSASAQDRNYTFEFNMEINNNDLLNPDSYQEITLKVTLIDDKDKYKKLRSYDPCGHENIKFESDDPFYNIILLARNMRKGLSDICYIYPDENGIIFPCCDLSINYEFIVEDGFVALNVITNKSNFTYYSKNKNADNLRVFNRMKIAAKNKSFYGFEVDILDD